MTVLGRKPARTVDPAASSDSIASARDLVRRYGDTIALDGVTMSVAPGELVGVLGPNGAGKSTLIALLTGLRRPTSGTVSVLGGDPRLPSTRLRLGVTPQETGLPETLQVHEVVDFVGAHYPDPVATGDLLERFGLSQLARRKTGAMSGGQKRRLAIALAFVGRPDLVFLDEPTTGLDPRARAELWDVLDTLVGRGTTLMLTTQYLEEAERLADDIIVVDHGRIIARGDSRKLKREVGGDHIHVVVVDGKRLGETAAIVASATGTDVSTDPEARSVNAPTSGGVDTLIGVAQALRDADIDVDDLSIRQPTLDDVFLTLTGSDTQLAEETPK